MPKIIPVDALKNTSEISDLCRDTEEPIYITKDGYGDMVLMTIEMYEELTGARGTAEAADEAIKNAMTEEEVIAKFGKAPEEPDEDVIALLEAMSKYDL